MSPVLSLAATSPPTVRAAAPDVHGAVAVKQDLRSWAGTQQIPPGLEARAARWRDFAAGKKILLLLDDAAGHEQVRPLAGVPD